MLIYQILQTIFTFLQVVLTNVFYECYAGLYFKLFTKFHQLPSTIEI